MIPPLLWSNNIISIPSQESSLSQHPQAQFLLVIWLQGLSCSSLQPLAWRLLGFQGRKCLIALALHSEKSQPSFTQTGRRPWLVENLALEQTLLLKFLGATMFRSPGIPSHVGAFRFSEKQGKARGRANALIFILYHNECLRPRFYLYSPVSS